MSPVLNRFSSSSRFGIGHHVNASGGMNFLDTFFSNSWPYDAIEPLQAYLFGVLTCVVLFVAYNFFLHPPIAAAPLRGGSRKKNSSSKRKNRNIFKSGTTLRMKESNASGDIHLLRPPTRMDEKPFSEDKVYRRLSSRIRKRAATRVFRKSTWMAKNTPGRDVGRSTGMHQYEDSTKLICRVVDHHPIARNRARYNQKKIAIHSENIQPKLLNFSSPYNDGKIWPSSSVTVSESSIELFMHMNSQPLRKDVKTSCTNMVSRDEMKKNHHSSSSSHGQVKSQERPLRKNADLLSGKENVHWQLVGSNSPKDATPRIINSRASFAKKTSEDSRAKSYSSHKATSSAKGNVLKEIPSQKGRTFVENKIKDNQALDSKNSQETQQFSMGPKTEAGKDYLQMEEPNNCLDTRTDELLPGSQSIGEAGDKPIPVASASRLTVLISQGVYDYKQKANQKAALNLLQDLCIPYNIVDGMDPMQREIRNAFFEISGVRGNYPQIFLDKCFLGGYDWLHNNKIEDLKKFARE